MCPADIKMRMVKRGEKLHWQLNLYATHHSAASQFSTASSETVLG